METDNMFPVRKRRSTLSAELCRMVGSLITELATPDVLYNNRFWPEEDSIRITVERDLFVWKIFEDNQVLWDVFDLYSSSPLAMCRCSPVLKSITASLMNYFESCRQKQASHSPRQMEACCKLVRCLSKESVRISFTNWTTVRIQFIQIGMCNLPVSKKEQCLYQIDTFVYSASKKMKQHGVWNVTT
ncbi:INTS5 [Mytilus edulis]|uniref:INTS5 n=1 Tax=Mytilus edulis TaxID=6550 RepID=A0A8S3TJ59_MYTED|nr:INTS5 [Mytilus edulis]